MIVDQTETELTGNLKFARKVPMNLSASAAPVIIRSLTNLYSNPYLAVLREYTSNAYDSHVRAGQTRPVEVTLPSRMSATLVVEDFGVGLDADELDAYGQYGDTTKNKTNDQIGGFGLGSKSGLAVCSQFTVTSVKDGYMNTMVVGYNDTGHPTLGYLNDEPIKTDKPNGVKITIPTTEYGQFQEAQTNNMFIGWPENSILINGMAPGKSIHNTDQYTPVSDAGWLATTPTNASGYFDYRSKGTALVGPVKYRVDWNKIEGVTDAMATGFLRDAVLKLDIGSVKLIPSREDILYTAETRQAIKAAVQEIQKHGQSIIQAQVEKASSIREALQKRAQAINYGFKADYTWGGAPLEPTPYKDFNLRGSNALAVTSAYVRKQDSGYRVTYKVSRDYIDLYNQDRMIDLGIKNEDYVLVVGSETATDVKTGYYGYKKLHESAKKNLAAYVRGEVAEAPEADNRSVGDRQYLFTSQTKKQIDRSVLGAFNYVIEHKDFLKDAEQRKKDLIKRAREATKKDGTVSARLTKTDVRELSYAGNGRSVSNIVSLDTIDTSKKYVLLDNSHRNDSVKTTLESNLREAVTTNIRYKSNLDQIARILVYERDVTFLLTNKTTNIDIIKETLPNLTTIQAEVEEYLKGKVGTLSDTQAQALYDLENIRTSWTTSLVDVDIARIDREKTRDWIMALRTKNLQSDYKAQTDAVELASQIGIDISKYNMTAPKKADSPAMRYPLLAELWSSRGLIDPVIQYINLIDGQLED